MMLSSKTRSIMERLRGWNWSNFWSWRADGGARPTLSLSQHLGVLTLVVALPLIVVSFFMVGRFADSERHARRAFLVAATHSLADAVETELDKYFVISNALAHSRSLAQGNLTEFERTASEILSSLPDASLVVSTPDGRPLLDTQRQPGADPGPSDQSDRRPGAFATDAPTLSDIGVDPISQTPVASIETPIFHDGKPQYLLILKFSSRRLTGLLDSEKYPAGWIAAIIDRAGQFVARAPEGKGRPGTPASPSFRGAMGLTREAIVNNSSLEGEPVISAYTRIDYGWTVSIAAKAEVLDESLSQTLWLLSLLAAGSLAASFALAFFANRRLAFGVRLLQKTAKDIGAGKPVVPNPTGVREFDELSLAFGEASSLLRERAIQRQIAEAERSASEEKFRLLADSLPQLVWTAGPDGRVDYTNARRERYGKVGLTRTDWDGVIHPEDLRGTVAAWLKASETGEPYEMEHRLMIIGKGFSWHLSRASLLRDSSGEPVKWYGTTMDIHEHKMREEHIRVLMTEVNHRSKNLLAVTQAIARQTVSSSATAAEFEQKFSARLLGLSASQDLLTNEKWRGVRLEALVRSQIGHYSDVDEGRIGVAGPDVLLNSTAAQAIGMALHELSTNAVKYGALSNDVGHIATGWRFKSSTAGPMLEMDWIERGGPLVEAPHAHGFGSVVIEKMLAQRLNAVVHLSFEREGLTWRLLVPLKNIEANDDLTDRADMSPGHS
ncbi:sensor histidine kinase [Methylocapsa sp. S129]|uniref:sensor histidine kinase n=1 Tax=Methylocapsa sp. S129 TaxID=1641869 RepID=UPI00131E4C9E|nr:HWE histidine kinase domain-containing protein [Methylocapsa sp. S129]